MTRILLKRLVFLIVILLLNSSCGGCNGCRSTPSDWVYESPNAPYKLSLSGYWKKSKEKYNDHADLSLSRGPLRAIIIPQPPDSTTTPTPELIDIKAASLRQMRSAIKNLVIEDNIKTIAGNDPAETVFSRGEIDGEPFFYITTYTKHNDWIYQIICWSPLKDRDALTQASTQLLSSWTPKKL